MILLWLMAVLDVLGFSSNRINEVTGASTLCS
jgi:hypothetical protein